jgi:SAM-dependent methyltransferase
MSLDESVLTSPKPSMTSTKELIDCDLSVFICPQCTLTQKPPLPESSYFYDKNYRISLASDDFDQLYAFKDGVPVYRTDYQAEVLLNKVTLSSGDMVLDYGAGKGTTLQKLLQKRPDIIPYIFDVSNEYRDYWKKYLQENNTATYSLPQNWKNKFALITSHFVFEHTENLYHTLKDIAGLLQENGILFFIVPNLFSNPGDILARDHVNHFNIPALEYVLCKAGFVLDSVDETSFRGAYVCIAKRNDSVEVRNVNSIIASRIITDTKKITQFWNRIDTFIRTTTYEQLSRPSAIFGAGLYGAYIKSKLPKSNNCVCFIDNNSHLIGTELMHLPILSPAALPGDVEIVYMGVNPKNARTIQTNISSSKPLTYVFLD